MFDNDHPLLSTASLTALILHAAGKAPVTLATCSAGLDDLFRRANMQPGLPEDERRVKLARQINHLKIARILEPDAEGRLALTARGREVLDRHPDGLDQTILVTFPEFAAYLHASAHHPAGMDPRVQSYDEGYSAQQDGLPFTANPYSENSVDHQSWENGWMQAQDTQQQAAPFRPLSEP
ncbi:MAG: hypothetical protein EP318_11045 [Rhodobacteraceae bacterium]|nr:MAG: hypothetical protein EP318_11045 [Paracoccaceae bacterium]